MHSFAKGKPHTRDHILDDSDILQVKRSLKSWVEQFVFLGLLYTGMRVSEFVHFRRRWINWQKGFIVIPREQACRCYDCQRKGGVWRPKTTDGARPIPILPEVETLFRVYFKKYDSVMSTVTSRVYAWMILKKVERRSGVKLFPHVLRGTFSTLLANRQFTEAEIKDILGWRSFKTADEYIKLSGSRVKKAVDTKWREVQQAIMPTNPIRIQRFGSPATGQMTDSAVELFKEHNVVVEKREKTSSLKEELKKHFSQLPITEHTINDMEKYVTAGKLFYLLGKEVSYPCGRADYALLIVDPIKKTSRIVVAIEEGDIDPEKAMSFANDPNPGYQIWHFPYSTPFHYFVYKKKG